jgi:hypothetical protein
LILRQTHRHFVWTDLLAAAIAVLAGAAVTGSAAPRVSMGGSAVPVLYLHRAFLAASSGCSASNYRNHSRIRELRQNISRRRIQAISNTHSDFRG